jgi:hypothetical protein
MYLFFGLTLLSVSLATKPRLGWGQLGHTTVADIATEYVNDITAEVLDVILGGLSMGDVSSWADQIRNDVDWTTPLHFIDVQQDPCTNTNNCEFVYDRDCVDDACISGAIANYSAVLYALNPKGLETTAANDSAKFVIHFVGDIHQPLHVSKADDMGGNTIEVTFEGDDWNLHSIWDTALISKDIEVDFDGDSEAFTKYLVGMIDTAWKNESSSWTDCSCTAKDGQHFTANLKSTEIISIEPEVVLCCANQWAEETLYYALNDAYLNEFGEEIVSGDEITLDYYELRMPVIEKRLAIGGVRLAALMDALLA